MLKVYASVKRVFVWEGRTVTVPAVDDRTTVATVRPRHSLHLHVHSTSTVVYLVTLTQGRTKDSSSNVQLGESFGVSFFSIVLLFLRSFWCGGRFLSCTIRFRFCVEYDRSNSHHRFISHFFFRVGRRSSHPLVK